MKRIIFSIISLSIFTLAIVATILQPLSSINWEIKKTGILLSASIIAGAVFIVGELK